MESAPPENESPKQICTITVIFPVVSDDEAIAVKKKIGDAVAEISESRVDFRITNLGRPRV